MKLIRLYSLVFALLFFTVLANAQNTVPDLEVSFKYSPVWWQTGINLPESSRKSIVGKDGGLMYEYPAIKSATPQAGFGTIINFFAGEGVSFKSQELFNARTPMVITHKELNGMKITEEAFTVAPLLFGNGENSPGDFLGTWLGQKINGKPGNDLVIVTYENTGAAKQSINPEVRIITNHDAIVDTAKGKVFMGGFLRVAIPHTIVKTSTTMLPNDKNKKQLVLTLKAIDLEAGGKSQIAFGVAHGYTAIDCPNNLKQALALQRQSIAWWQVQPLPYNKIMLPDSGIQNLLDASIRNIYQLADNVNGHLVFNTGASVGRSFSVSDAPFIIDALTMLGQTDFAREGLGYMLSLQKNDGSFSQQEKDWKQTGMALWAISNYARLTGDKQWLDKVWPNLEKGFNFLIELQKSTLGNSKLPYTGLIPPGAGSGSQGIDYANNFWALAGLNSAITAARWASRNAQAIKWQSLYDEYYKTFLESTGKNMKKDAAGNSYLPVIASADKKPVTQQMQWAFLNAVYPGKIFDLNNPVLTGNLKILEPTVQEGLLVNTGQANNSIVLSAASDYAHALQWTGKAHDAGRVAYALANHAAPNFAWFEQQSPQNLAEKSVAGDMPNSRVASEFIRTVRHLLVMERSNELHLFEGVPASWTKPGMEIKLNGILTEFGALSFSVKFSDDGNSAVVEMNLDTLNRRVPQKILFHLDGITGNPAVMELELKPNMRKVLNLK